MTDFECVECGYGSVKWLGRCPSCSQWDTIVQVSKFTGPDTEAALEDVLVSEPVRLSDISHESSDKIKSGLKELDNLFGGGFVEGEVILLGGPPGVGKSTLFLQIAGSFSRSGSKVLYISGEENPSQIKIHSTRLGISGENIVLFAVSDLSAAEKEIDRISPDVVIVDSIQAVAVPGETGAPGSVKQVKRSTAKLVSAAKNTKCIVFISGQITKEGSIAGPKVLEHMVDAVAYIDILEADLRIISTAKNRFGACGDFLLYKIGSSGLKEQKQPAAGAAEESIAGQAAVCVKTGSRFQAARIQALVSESYFEYPLRRTSGFSRERLLMLSAIASKHMGMKLSSSDIYLNVGGGMKINERSADIGVLAALYSNLAGKPPPPGTIFIGEAGLAGEVSPAVDIERRLKFAESNKFSTAVISSKNTAVKSKIKTIQIEKVKELKNILTGGR